MKLNKFNLFFCLLILLSFNCNNKNKKNFTYLNSIFINVNVNDSISGKFILDSGADRTILDSKFVEDNSIKLISDGSKFLLGNGNSNSFEIPTFKNIKIYTLNKKVNSPYIYVYNLKKQIPIEDGIIGNQFFKENIIKIDYENQTLTFLDSKTKIGKSYSKIPLVIKNNRLYVNMKLTINNKISISGLFLIDTGSEFAIALNNYYTDSLNLYDKIAKKIDLNIKNGGIGGNSHKYLIKGKLTKISNLDIQDILIACSNQKTGALGYTKKYGIGSIGNLFLDKFNVIFETKDSILYLQANNSYYNKFSIYKAGIILGEKSANGFIIKSILKNFPASKKNILENDILLKIDNQKTSKLGYIKTKYLLNKKGKHKLKILRKNQIIKETINVTDLMNLI